MKPLPLLTAAICLSRRAFAPGIHGLRRGPGASALLAALALTVQFPVLLPTPNASAQAAPNATAPPVPGAPGGASPVPDPNLAVQTPPPYSPSAISEPEANTPPTAQAYVTCSPGVQTMQDQTMVPVEFLGTGLGASAGPLDDSHWRIIYFGRQFDFGVDSQGALADGTPITLPAAPYQINGQLYVPLAPIATWLGMQWSVQTPPTTDGGSNSTLLIQYPAAFIKSVRTTVYSDKVRTVVTLSNATRVVAGQQKLDVGFQFAGARQGNIPTVNQVNDYLVPRTVLRSGDWKAGLMLHLNYAAPVQWFTLGGPPRLVVDVERLFEEQTPRPQEGGIMVTKIRRGTGHGPVQMWAVKLDPRDGWRMKVEPGGWGVAQRERTSLLASRSKSLLAMNGGFFAYDGAALGAVMVDGEWIRLPWHGRTAMGFKADGTGRIDNMQCEAYVEFGSGLRVAVRDLNSWPGPGLVSCITSRFLPYYKFKPGEMAVVVKNGRVIAKPGGGGAGVSAYGFTLVASGGARWWLNKAQRGDTARLVIRPIGWDGVVNALGAGPRLVKDGRVYITDARENFRPDVRFGAGPRTAFGLDREGRYIMLIADGRQGYYSTGLTLTETADVMVSLGAVDAMNLDGGGSTAMAVRGHVVNRPSDGHERNVANALVVVR